MLECRQQTQELFGFAGVGEGDEDVARADCAEVAVQGLHRMQEGGGRAGGVERGGDFAGDDARLSYAGDDDVATLGGTGGKQGEGLLERWLHGGVEAVGEQGEGLGFDADELGWCRRRHACLMLSEQMRGGAVMAGARV